MKKTIISFLVLLGFLSVNLTGCGINRIARCQNLPKLNVFNWGEYIDIDVITDFEFKHNVCVNYSTFSDNETAITKMRTEKYDVVFPSEYAIEQLRNEGQIEKIDWSKLSVDKNTVFADPLNTLLNNMKESLNYDFLEYAVPYLWGSVGIVYNPKKVPLEVLQKENWDILKNKDYNSVFYDSSKDAYMIALKQLGYSMNTTNLDEIKEATKWLEDVVKTNRKNISFLTDEILDSMPRLDYDLAVCYSGDANYIMEKNWNLKFYKPTTGTNVWVDGMVIPKNSENKDLAYQFIDFLLTDDAAYDNSLYVGYTSPIKSVYEEIIGVEGDFYHLRDSYQVDVNEKDELYKYLGPDIKALIEGNWLKIKI